MQNNSLDFRLRKWLVRRLTYNHTLDQLTQDYDKVVMHKVVEKLHEVIIREVREIVTESVSNISTEMLANVIAANKNVSDLQKSVLVEMLNNRKVAPADLYR